MLEPFYSKAEGTTANLLFHLSAEREQTWV